MDFAKMYIKIKAKYFYFKKYHIHRLNSRYFHKISLKLRVTVVGRENQSTLQEAKWLKKKNQNELGFEAGVLSKTQRKTRLPTHCNSALTM